MPTRAGRRAVAGTGGRPVAADPEATRVALGGREAMADQRLRAEIFDRPTTAPRPGLRGRGSRDVDHSDPRLAAHRTGSAARAAGGAVFFDIGGFDGGAT